MTSPDLSAESAPLANWQERWKIGTESHHHRASLSLAVTESTFFFFFPFLLPPLTPRLSSTLLCSPALFPCVILPLKSRCAHAVCSLLPVVVSIMSVVLNPPELGFKRASYLPIFIVPAITCLIELLQDPSTMRSARFWNSTMRTQRPLFLRYGYPPSFNREGIAS